MFKMNADKKNFWLDMAIFINFIILIFAAHSSLWIHVGAGLTLLACLILHIARHWWWLKAVCRTGRAKSEKILRNRTINIGLLIVSVLTILSGVMTFIMSGNLIAGNPLDYTSDLHRWKRLHQTGAMLMFVLVVWHFAVHWNWLVSVARKPSNKTSSPD
jgi:hypothetical protein